MNQLLKKLFCLLFFTGLIFSAFAIKKKYGNLVFKRADIDRMKAADFKEFKFRFKFITGGCCILEGLAYDINNKPIGETFVLDFDNRPGCRSMPNLLPGIFTVTKGMLSDAETGNFDLYLRPKKFKEGTPYEQDYVSYSVYDKQGQPLKDYGDWDPSPPAV